MTYFLKVTLLSVKDNIRDLTILHSSTLFVVVSLPKDSKLVSNLHRLTRSSWS